MNLSTVGGSVNRRKKGVKSGSQPEGHGRRSKLPAHANGSGVNRKDGNRPRKGRVQSGAAGLQHAQAGNELRETPAVGSDWKRSARELGFPETHPAIEGRVREIIKEAIDSVKSMQKSLEHLSLPYEKRLEGFLQWLDKSSEYKKLKVGLGFASWYGGRDRLDMKQRFTFDILERWFWLDGGKYVFGVRFGDDGEAFEEDVPCGMRGCRELLTRKFKVEDVLIRWVRHLKITCLSEEE